jgi:hypothetical protein
VVVVLEMQIEKKKQVFQCNLLQQNDKHNKDCLQNNLLGYTDILHSPAVL